MDPEIEEKKSAEPKRLSSRLQTLRRDFLRSSKAVKTSLLSARHQNNHFQSYWFWAKERLATNHLL
jgi:hypothetical protein